MIYNISNIKIKMKNSIEPIDIQIEDNKRFSLIALLVDRNDFLEDIKKIRKKISLIVVPYELPGYSIKGFDNVVEAYKSDTCTINGVRIALEQECLDKNIVNTYQIDKKIGKAVVWSETLLKKYKKSRPYFSVIFASLLAGKVTDFDFPSTYMLEFNNQNDARLETDNFISNEDLTAIVVNPNSTQIEVIKTFGFIKKYYFKTKKTTENDGLKHLVGSNFRTEQNLDTLSSIKETRKWFWWNKNEKIGAKKIWDRIGGIDSGISQKGIEQNLTRYKKLLQK